MFVLLNISVMMSAIIKCYIYYDDAGDNFNEDLLFSDAPLYSSIGRFHTTYILWLSLVSNFYVQKMCLCFYRMKMFSIKYVSILM